jgi:preprotein translocase subunit SecD
MKIAQIQQPRAATKPAVSWFSKSCKTTLREPHPRLSPIYDGSRAAYAAKLLSATGTVVLRIQPRGPEYHSPSGRPFRAAQVFPNVTGELAVWITSSDPPSLEEFTRAHIGQDLGVYFDRRLIDAPKLVGPISGTAEIWGPNYNDAQLRFMATVIDSGPLPAHVRLLSSSPLSSV